MTLLSTPTSSQPIVQTDSKGAIADGIVDSVWYQFFQSVIDGDTGTAWTPIATGLTTVGTPTITGGYWTNQGFTDFFIRIVPGTSTTSTSPSTYFDLPFLVSYDDACLIGGLPGVIGLIDAATKRCYTPSWSAVANPITIRGRVVSQ